MAFEPLRFLHAANVRLGQPIGQTCKLPPNVAAVLHGAAKTAFERLIAVALERRVDFVLLAGNSFIEADQCLAARLALLDGLRRLADREIRVFVLPGPHDPLEAWRAIPDLPENVTILDPHQKSSATYKLDGKLIARIGGSLRMADRKKARAAQRELRSESQRPVPFTIGVVASDNELDDARALDAWSTGRETEFGAPAEHDHSSVEQPAHSLGSPVDYAAFGSGRARRTFARRQGVAHDPGSLQGTSPRESGPRGGTFVDVESDGTVRCEFIPTAAVRWERHVIPVDPTLGRHDLLRRCAGLLQETATESGEASGEKIWIVEWILRGSPVAVAPFAEAGRRQLAQELRELAPLPGAGVESVAHDFLIHADPDALGSSVTSDPLHADFSDSLKSCRRTSGSLFAASLAELASVNPEWARRLEDLATELEPDAIAAAAERFGWAHVRPPADESAGSGAGAGAGAAA